MTTQDYPFDFPLILTHPRQFPREEYDLGILTAQAYLNGYLPNMETERWRHLSIHYVITRHRSRYAVNVHDVRYGWCTWKHLRKLRLTILFSLPSGFVDYDSVDRSRPRAFRVYLGVRPIDRYFRVTNIQPVRLL